MTSNTFEAKLCSLLITIAQREQEIELLRISLCQNSKFHPLNMFEEIVISSEEFLSALSLTKYLGELIVPIEGNEADLLLDQYSSTGDT